MFHSIYFIGFSSAHFISAKSIFGQSIMDYSGQNNK